MPNFDFASMLQIYGQQKPVYNQQKENKDWLKSLVNNELFSNSANILAQSSDNQSTDKTVNGINTLTSSGMQIAGSVGGVPGQIASAGFNLGKIFDNSIANLSGGKSKFDPNTKIGTGTDKLLETDLFRSIPTLGFISSINALTSKKFEPNLDLQKNIFGYKPQNLETTQYGGITSLFSKKDEQGFKNFKRGENQNILAANIGKGTLKKQEAATNMMPFLFDKNKQKLQNLFDPRVLTAKQGTKLSLKNIKVKVNSKIKKASLGMKFNEPNVIVDGAFHSRKHNIDIENLTPKGVPVIMEEGGEITQTAEVERNELIFNLKTTQELEKLYKKFKDGDENAALEAGKLLTYEILENTNDNTNLLNTI